MRTHYTAIVGLIVLGCTSGCGTVPTIRHSGFKARHPSIRTMAITPPKVEVYKVTFQGDRKIMFDVIPSISQWIVEELKATFEKRGYRIQVMRVDDPAAAADPSLKSTLFTVQELFDQRIKESKKGFFALLRKFQQVVGPDINVLADLTDSDAVIFVRCFGYKKTGGEIAKDWAQSLLIGAVTLGNVMVIPYPSATVVQLGVIDGNTGDILWYADNSHTDQVAFDIAREKKLRKVIKQFASNFPKAASMKKTKTSSQTAHLAPPAVPVATRP